MAVSAPTNDIVLLDFNSAADGTTIVKSGGRLTVGTAVSGTSPFADGSLAAPSITFASDLGLGFFRIGADIIGGATAGVLGFRYGGASQTSVLGAGAFAARTAGTGGTAVGHGAGAALTNTANVTALGANANGVLTSANGSTSVGSNSQATTDATSLGFGALALGTRGVAIGAGAGGGTGTQGADNVVIGPFAFDGNKTNSPTGVVAIGLNALGGNLTVGACNSIAIGADTLSAQTSGATNIAIGHKAASNVTTGASNVVIGANTASLLLTGSGNICLGHAAVLFEGDAQTVVGVGASSTNTGTTLLGRNAASDGSNSIAIGFSSTASGLGSIIIGNAAGSTGMGTNCIAIGRNALDGVKSAAVTGIVAIGVNALTADLTGVAAVNSVAIGSSALAAQSSGVGNTAVGFNAGTAVSTGSNNTAVGNLAGSLLSIGSSNAFFGRSAGANVQSGSSNVYIGSTADTSGAVGGVSNNVGIGAASVTSGLSAVGIGASSTTSADNTVVIGANAVGSAPGNIIVGQSAGSTGMGINNIAIGIDCLDGTKSNSPTGIVAIGPLAMRGAVSVAASNCTAVGFSALNLVTGGTNNTAVGHSAGSTNLTTGSNNTLLGSGASVDAAGRAGTVVLGQGAAGTADNGLFFRTATLAQTGGLPMRFDTANGRAGPDTSSIRFKTDVTLAPYDGSLSKLTAIDKIRVIEFKSKTAEHDDPILGVIAEEAAEHVHPSLIARDDHNDVVGIDYSHLSCMLLQEIQFLRREVAKLKLNPLPALPDYTPVREEDIYPAKRRGDDNLMAAQKAQGKEARKNRKASHAVDDIEDEPEKEAEIMAKYNPEMQSRIRAEQERRAQKEAEAEEAERARLEAEAKAAEAEAEVKEE